MQRAHGQQTADIFPHEPSRLHRHTCNQDLAVALWSGLNFATFSAVTKGTWQASVSILASHWASDEVPPIFSPIHTEDGLYAAR